MGNFFLALFKSSVVAVALLFTFLNADLANARECRGFFEKESLVDVGVTGLQLPEQSSPKLRENNQLKIVTWNLFNLKIPKVEYPAGSEAARKTSKNEQKRFSKEEWALEEMGNAANEIKADIYVVQEVFSKESLEYFVKNYMNGEYEVVLEKGNDERGIQVGFIVKKFLDVDYELRTHKDIKFTQPRGVYKIGEPVFSRDLPALYLRQKDGSNSRASDEPDLVVLAAHLKSKRETPGDFESTQKRTLEAEMAAVIVQQMNKRFNGRVPIVLGGDFNTPVMNAKETESLRTVLKDSLDLMGNKLTSDDKVTHTFHPMEGGLKAHQLDGLLINDAMANKFVSASVYHYKDPHTDQVRQFKGKWESKFYPLTFSQRKKNPSDHMPIVGIYDMTR